MEQACRFIHKACRIRKDDSFTPGSSKLEHSLLLLLLFSLSTLHFSPLKLEIVFISIVAHFWSLWMRRASHCIYYRSCYIFWKSKGREYAPPQSLLDVTNAKSVLYKSLDYRYACQEQAAWLASIMCSLFFQSSFLTVAHRRRFLLCFLPLPPLFFKGTYWYILFALYTG